MPGRELDPQAEVGGAVIEGDLGSYDGGFAALDRFAVGLEAFQDGFDVLAGAEGVRLEVRASAGVIAGVEPADGDGVLPLGLGVCNTVVGEDAVLPEVFDGQIGGAGALAAEVNLFFAEHRLVSGRARRAGPVHDTGRPQSSRHAPRDGYFQALLRIRETRANVRGQSPLVFSGQIPGGIYNPLPLDG